MGCGNSQRTDEDEMEDNTPGLTQVYFDETLGTSKHKKILVSNFKIKLTLTKGARGANALIQLPKTNALTTSGHGSVNIWTTAFDSIIDTQKLHNFPINDLLLIEQRIFISISSEDKIMKAFYISNKIEKIFETELDYSPLHLHGVNLLKETKRIAISHSEGIVLYDCSDKINQRDKVVAMDDYDRYLHKEESPIVHSLVVEEVMSFFLPKADISISVLLNGNCFVFNSLYSIKIWYFKKQERKEIKENKRKSRAIRNSVLDEWANLEKKVAAKKKKKSLKTENKEIVNEAQETKNEEPKFKREVDPEQIKSIIILKGHPKEITCLYGLREGHLASGAKDKKIFIWDVKKQSIIKYLDGHLGYISALFQLNEGNLVSGDNFCNIIIWSKNFLYKVASVYQDGIILRFFQLISGELLSISSKEQIKVWTFKRTYGKEKTNVDDEIDIKQKNQKSGKRKKKRKKTKREKEMDKRYRIKDEDFKDIYAFIEQEKNNEEQSEES